MSRVWSDEEDSLLRDLCETGLELSAPGIARLISETFAIRPPLTRAAVVGRARRRRYKLPIDRNGTGNRISARATPQHNVASPLPAPKRGEEPPMPKARLSVLPEHPSERVPGIYLLNAGHGDCRWPITNPPKGQMHTMRVCGLPAEDGSSYCPACAKKAFGGEWHSQGGAFVLPVKRGVSR